MTVPFEVRLLCVSLAAFAVVFTAAAFATWVLAAPALRAAERMRAQQAGRLCLALRLGPAAIALALVLFGCLPSYLRFEQRGSDEEVGAACLTLAAAAAIFLGAGLWRAYLALRQSAIQNPSIALVSVLRSRVVISAAVKTALSHDQLELAIRHEEAHAQSRDNFKRFLMRLAPSFPGAVELETAWKRFAEWSADDYASAGEQHRALTLAAALVRVAKLDLGTLSPLATPLLASSADLEQRVSRLLNPEILPPKNGLFTPLCCLPGALLLAAAAEPARIYALLERLIH